MSKRLISFTESSTVIRPHIKQYLEVFIHGFDKNVGQNPALDNLTISKLSSPTQQNWLGLAYGETFANSHLNKSTSKNK